MLWCDMTHSQYWHMLELARLYPRNRHVRDAMSFGPYAECQWEIIRWAVKHRLHDFRLWTAPEWDLRGERVGARSLFTVTCEGDALAAIDGRVPELRKEFDAICDRHGLYHEFGYIWSLHFYRSAYVHL